MISGDVVNDLCRLGVLGESESAEAQVLLRRLRPRGELSRRHWEEWKKVCDALEIENLALLVRGLLLTEEALSQWSSGSVSPVIWTYRALEKRSLVSARAVADWGREKTTNSYVPFSEERKRYWEAKRKRAASVAELQRQQQADAELRRRERSRLAETHRRVSSSNARERAETIQRLAELPLAERLQVVVEKQDRDLAWFPELWATEAVSAVGELTPKLRDELVERLTGYRKGPWRRLRDALLRSGRTSA